MPRNKRKGRDAGDRSGGKVTKNAHREAGAEGQGPRQAQSRLKRAELLQRPFRVGAPCLHQQVAAVQMSWHQVLERSVDESFVLPRLTAS